MTVAWAAGTGVLLGTLAATCATAAPAARVYYVDSRHGDDRNSGTARAPWRSLKKATARRIKPGEVLLLVAGSVWREPLRVLNSGTREAPIRIAASGNGPMPRIDAGGTATNAVEIVNVEYVHLSGIEITNRGQGDVQRRGVLISADNVGILHDIKVSDLYIHDVNGTNTRKETGGIVFRTTGAKKPSRFDMLTIERNIVWRTDRSGIVAQSDQLSRKRWHPSRGVVIRDNYVEDVGGDGIVPWATDGALVEHNIVRHAAQRAPGANAAIWQWSTKDTLFRLNDAAKTKGTLDGQGFDSDFNSTGTTFINNYSHENDGGFMLICTPVRRDPEENIGNSGTVIRQNISWHDRERAFHLSGADDVLVADNAIYTAPGDDVQMFLVSEWEGWGSGATFRNNLFDAAGPVRYGHAVAKDEVTGRYRMAPGWGPAKDIRFVGNRYVGTHIDRPDDQTPSAAPASLRGQSTDWTPPAFDPARPAGFRVYLARHRAWMTRLMARQFDRPARTTSSFPLVH